MPLYEFRCDPCGGFELWRTMAESSNPAHCPTCNTPARRIFSPPAISLSSALRSPSSPEPQLVKRTTDREPEKPRFKSHTGDRPWMISH